MIPGGGIDLKSLAAYKSRDIKVGDSAFKGCITSSKNKMGWTTNFEFLPSKRPGMISTLWKG